MKVSPPAVGVYALVLVGAFLLGRSHHRGAGAPSGAEGAPAAPARAGGEDSAGQRFGRAVPAPGGMTLEAIRRHAEKSDKNRLLAGYFATELDRDPAAALAQVRRVESLRYDAARTVRVFAGWAQQNPEKASELLADVLDGRQFEPGDSTPFVDGIDSPEFLLALVFGLGQADPGLAGKTLAGAAPGPASTSAIEVLLQGWYARDPAGARGWAGAMRDPTLRRDAVVAAASEAGQEDPSSATGWALSLPAEDRQAAVFALVSEWAPRRADEAFTWVTGIADRDLMLSVMPAALRDFTSRDPGAAADWLNRFDPGPEMDASIAAYARGVFVHNPAAAIGSVDAIVDPVRREALGRSLTDDWVALDPAAARAYLDQQRPD